MEGSKEVRSNLALLYLIFLTQPQPILNIADIGGCLCFLWLVGKGYKQVNKYEKIDQCTLTFCKQAVNSLLNMQMLFISNNNYCFSSDA